MNPNTFLMYWPLYVVVLLLIFIAPYALRMVFEFLQKGEPFNDEETKAAHAAVVRRVKDLRLLLYAGFFAYMAVMFLLRVNLTGKLPELPSVAPSLEPVVVRQEGPSQDELREIPQKEQVQREVDAAAEDFVKKARERRAQK